MRSSVSCSACTRKTEKRLNNRLKKFNINNFVRTENRKRLNESIVTSDSDSDQNSDELQCSVKVAKMNSVSESTSDINPVQNGEHSNIKSLINNAKDDNTVKYNVKTSNRFAGIANRSEDGMETEEEQNENEHQDNDETVPPPIIIHGQTNKHKELVNLIKSRVKGDFNFKYTKNNINLTIHNRAERDKLVKHLQDQSIDYHTYSEKSNKTHAFVVRGLTSDVEPTELSEDLKNSHGLPVVNCFKMKFNNTERYTPNTLFLLITDNTVTLKGISREIKYALHTRVYFERRRNNKRITQCHKCQLWGHATSNCYATTRCLFCAENHATKDCKQKQKTKCANCKGVHQANDTNCPQYLQRLKWLDDNNPKKQNATRKDYQHNTDNFPAYIPAPIPAQNAWTQRPAQQQTATQRQPAQQHQGQQQWQQTQPRQQTTQPSTYTGKPPITYQQPLDTFQQVNDQFKTLHTLVNMDGLLQAVTDLNELLKTCTDGNAKFQAYSQFTKNIHKYGI